MLIKNLEELVDVRKFKLFQAIETKNSIRINQFYIKIELRNQGIGTNEMKKIIQYANKVKKDIVVYATSSKNKRFYRRNGFKNSSEDYMISCNMRRKYEEK